MSDDLFFVSILERAFGQRDVKSALRDAFGQIQAIGQQPRFQRGYEQFARFMREVAIADSQEAAEYLLDQFCKQFERPDGIDILVEESSQLIAKCSFRAESGKQVIDGIKPGTYRVRFDTGRVLWEGLLTEEDLIWARAHPGESLKAAAATGEVETTPAKEIPLLHGSLILRVFPGIAHGVLEIEVR